MKRFVTYALTAALTFSLISPAAANAQEVQHKEVESESIVSYGTGALEGYIFTTTTVDNQRTVVADNGVERNESTYDLETGDLYLDGELVDSDLRAFIDDIGNNLFESEDVSNLNEFTISPFSNEQGAGFGGSEWKYEFTDPGSFSYASLTVGAIAAIIASIFTGGILVPLIAGVATAIVGSFTSTRGTVYYTWKRYTKPHWNWPVLLKEYKEEVSFYKDSNRYQLITSETFYH
ncbi:hypothetical protein [Lysinibacillus fusiformis]|uniref:hypothetical protein n=1 Tax=Lysinibacillus fusiformis TaxID=28031 RepID=UPI001E651C74|nr:hypothetical protein [Lysinibacillus fusiformis]MCE4044620.1 hypothetical protein [Lysinibacillus fusiformis]UXJ67590.1 hypothetical protein N5069_15605 [Lysinibacillus fusiformis]